MMSRESSGSDACCHPEERGVSKTWWVVGGSLLLGLLGRYISILRPFSAVFRGYLKLILWPVLIGLVIGGLIDRFIPREYISKVLAHRSKRTVFYATGLGLLASACSHGILALSMELHKKGASGPAVISFLLASPWANFPVTLLLVGLFGTKGFLIILAAVIVALTTGLGLQALDAKGWIERNRFTSSLDVHFSISRDIRQRFQNYKLSFSQLKADFLGTLRGTFELSEMILGWVMFGVVLASLAQAYIPVHIFHHYLGPDLRGLFITLIFASLLEVCSEGTAPLAFEIYQQTKALGNSFVFLSAGVLTDYTEMGLVWKNLGKKTALWTLLIGAPQILILGYLFNRFF